MRALTTAVAMTLSERLVDFEGDTGRIALLIAVTAAVVVIAVLGRLGLPTSLTLAIMGAIAGAGWGSGLRIAWATLGIVLALAAIAGLLLSVDGVEFRNVGFVENPTDMDSRLRNLTIDEYHAEKQAHLSRQRP